ncbi:hypothetical protein Nepgr_026990 [Nepenthes gracilis]|uniref:Uncharacterized protein n=1 Tax=Nepenthes gracilis TaxID=150966 RepID=A0AAD3T971_NEPGR|nr:hypothetical protein Nepgr_026990 [Nepenthes gracilis]
MKSSAWIYKFWTSVQRTMEPPNMEVDTSIRIITVCCRIGALPAGLPVMWPSDCGKIATLKCSYNCHKGTRARGC